MPAFTPINPPDEPKAVDPLANFIIFDESVPAPDLKPEPLTEPPAATPRLRTAKTRVYQLRLTPDQWTELTRKAMFERLTVADYIRQRCGI